MRGYWFWLLRLSIALAGSCLTGAADHAVAQSRYPSRAVTIIVPFGAGTSLDLLGRLIASHLQSAFGQTFLVENRPGAGGMLGASAVARSAGDGHTLLITTSTTHSAVRGLFKQVPYDPVSDFTPIGKFA